MVITDRSYASRSSIKRDVCHIDGSVVHSAESSQMLYIMLCYVMLCYVMLQVTHNKKGKFFLSISIPHLTCLHPIICYLLL